MWRMLLCLHFCIFLVCAKPVRSYLDTIMCIELAEFSLNKVRFNPNKEPTIWQISALRFLDQYDLTS